MSMHTPIDSWPKEPIFLGGSGFLLVGFWPFVGGMVGGVVNEGGMVDGVDVGGSVAGGMDMDVDADASEKSSNINWSNSRSVGNSVVEDCVASGDGASVFEMCVTLLLCMVMLIGGSAKSKSIMVSTVGCSGRLIMEFMSWFSIVAV